MSDYDDVKLVSGPLILPDPATLPMTSAEKGQVLALENLIGYAAQFPDAVNATLARLRIRQIYLEAAGVETMDYDEFDLWSAYMPARLSLDIAARPPPEVSAEVPTWEKYFELLELRERPVGTDKADVALFGMLPGKVLLARWTIGLKWVPVPNEAMREVVEGSARMRFWQSVITSPSGAVCGAIIATLLYDLFLPEGNLSLAGTLVAGALAGHRAALELKKSFPNWFRRHFEQKHSRWLADLL